MRALEAVSRWPVDAAAAGVLVRTAEGDAAAAGAVGDLDRSFAWASVTKLCTALAVLVAVEEGTVGLDDPAGPPGSTILHLGAHASGLAPDRPSVLAAPATRRIYSNTGYEILGEHLAARSGLAFSTYLHEAVLEPLSMVGAAFAPGDSPARGMRGGLRDLLALGRELLAPTLLDQRTMAEMAGVCFGGLPGVLPGFGSQPSCDWGFGAEIRDHKDPHWTGRTNSPATFGHFGQAGGFVWVDPVAGVVLAALGDRPFDRWATTAWPELADAVLDEVHGGGAGSPCYHPLSV